MKAVTWLGAMALAAMVGCGSTANDDGDAMTIEAFTSGIAEAYCASLDHCDSGNDFWSVAQERCASDLARMIWGEGGFAYVPSSGYDAAAAAACVASLEGLCPPGGEMDPEEWCPQALGNCKAQVPWTQPVAQGAPCYGAKCAAGLWCTGTDLLTCQPRVPSGGTCTGGDCAIGVDCNIPNGICEPLPAPQPAQDPLDHPVGTPCQVSDFARQGGCNVGLVCLDTMMCGLPPATGPSLSCP